MMRPDKSHLIGGQPNVPYETYLSAIEAFSDASSINAIRKIGNDNLDIRYGSYHHIPAVGEQNFDKLTRYHAYNMPQQVLDYYDTTKPKDNPGILNVFARARAVWLSDQYQASSIIGTKHQELLKYVLDHSGDSLLIPVYGPYHRKGYIVIGFGKPKDFFDPIFAWQMQTIAQTIHVRYCMLMQGLRQSVHLTARESEVLELITFGKTNPEIGVILGISHNTVTGYVKKIFIKLETNDRVSAALRSQSFSLLT